MCGICGYLSRNKLEDELLVNMRDTMYHRGPNDAGIWQSVTGDGFVGLAHRRLSIFDLSELGHQPMLSEDGQFSVVFNGEIYNFKELRSDLQQKGYIFKSECDTEVILYAYQEWGTDAFSRFNGMFSIALWDKVSEELVISRDRLGVKPLYYYWNRSNSDFVFASELKPIMKYPGFIKEIDNSALGNYLCNKYIASPGTIFKDTYKLQPGCFAIYKHNELVIHKYWDIDKVKNKAANSIITDYDKAKKEIDDILTDAVAKRMVADVPVGTFLSSGIDSTLITAIAQKCSKTPVRTFTIGFDDKERNEADRACEIARYLGTDHTELYIGEKEIYDMLDDISRYYDEPFSDSSQLPTMLVSKLAADNVTVALSGDGGDEIFCGYKLYDLVYTAQRFDAIGNIVSHIPGLRDGLRRISPEMRAFIDNRNEETKTQLFLDVFASEADKLLTKDYKVINYKNSFEQQLRYRNWQERRMILDMMTYLPDEVMAKTDRASMKYSLEVRSPLLDYRVIEKSFEIPHNYKYHFFDKKHILKDLAYDYVPKEMLAGPKKGFGVPLKKWLRNTLKEEINKYSDASYLAAQGIFDASGIKRLILLQEQSDYVLYSSLLWSFYMFQRWWEEYMK